MQRISLNITIKQEFKLFFRGQAFEGDLFYLNENKYLNRFCLQQSLNKYKLKFYFFAP